MERNDRCFCGSGKKYKKCHYGINEKSKLADMYKANVLFDKACTARAIVNNCISGCSECCKDYFFVSENEFLMILNWLLYKGENIHLYKEKALETLEIIKYRHPDIVEQLNKYMPKGGSETLDSNYFKDDEKIIDLPPCIFLNSERKCSIYECRPIVCRTYGSTTWCDIIKNGTIEIKETTDLYNASTFIYGKNGALIMKRPYPIFYWFSFFLEEPFYSTMLLKATKFKDISESDYYDFSISIN